MFAQRTCLLIGVFCGVAAAAEWPNLTGTWMLDPSHSPTTKVKTSFLTIQQTEDAIDITDAFTDASGKDWKSVFHCNIDGNQCKVKDQGQNAVITFWYNGPALVMMENRHDGSYVVKKRLAVSDDGKLLTIELERINPPSGKPDVFAYVKQ
jgi:hypothetical protein